MALLGYLKIEFEASNTTPVKASQNKSRFYEDQGQPSENKHSNWKTNKVSNFVSFSNLQRYRLKAQCLYLQGECDVAAIPFFVGCFERIDTTLAI